MEHQKKADIEKRIEEIDELTVYEAEIIDEEEENTKIELRDAKSPVGKLAYKVGIAAGSFIATMGVFNEIRQFFKASRTNGGGIGRGMGKGIRRRKRKKRRL